MKNILYEYACNSSGKLVNAEVANKDDTFYCPNPECNSKMILHKCGNGINHHRSHFQHKSENLECNTETFLHHAFKIGLVDILRNYLIQKKQFIIKWKLDDYVEQTCNLLKITKEIVCEKTVDESHRFKPDISLIDSQGKVYAAIEIVVSHYPEAKALDFYSQNNIFLMQIELNSKNLNALDKIEEIALHPNIFTFSSLNYIDLKSSSKKEMCKFCGKEIKIADFKFGKTLCPKCNTFVKVPYIEWKSKKSKIMDTKIWEFHLSEIQFARENGCVITKRKSNLGNIYYTIDCPNSECNQKLNENINISNLIQQKNIFKWRFCPNCHSPIGLRKFRNIFEKSN